jgi:hypothetical protein
MAKLKSTFLQHFHEILYRRVPSTFTYQGIEELSVPEIEEWDIITQAWI